MTSRLVSSAADILAGLSALVLFVVTDSFLHVGADLREGVVVLSLLCLAAGLLRGTGRPKSAWTKGLLVASGGTLALLALGWSSMSHVFLAIFLLVANLFTICGVRGRQVWSQSAIKGWMILLAPVAALVIFAFTMIPTVATRVATRRITVRTRTRIFDDRKRRRADQLRRTPRARRGPRLLGNLVPRLPP